MFTTKPFFSKSPGSNLKYFLILTPILNSNDESVFPWYLEDQFHS